MICCDKRLTCSIAVFPGLVESIDDKDYKNAEKWVGIIEDLLYKASKQLE